VDLLASVRFAVGVVIVIAIACILGTVLPQGAEAAGYLRRNPGAAHWIDILARLGLTHVFTAWWFIGLLALLSATVATCSVRRIFTVRRTTGFARRRAFGSMLTHISILLILAGGVVRGIWGESGYVELREGETKNEFLIENRARPLPFALHLADFAVERYKTPASPEQDADCLHHELLVQWPARKLSARVPVRLNVSHSLTPLGEEPSAENTFIIRVAKYIPDFAMNSETREVMTRSEEPNNPAVLVEVNNPTYQNNCWLFARHPDFKVYVPGHEPSAPSPLRIFYRVESHPEENAPAPVKSFKSAVRVLNTGKPVREAMIEVNRPMRHGGYTFYQTGYDPKDPTWTSLQVVRDPGVPLVYAGFAFLIAGLFTVFYLNPWLNERSKEKEKLQVKPGLQITPDLQLAESKAL